MQSVWMSKNDYERRMRAVGYLFLSVCITAYSRIYSSFYQRYPKCELAGRLLIL